MPDRFGNHAVSLEGPAFHGFAITPSDVSGLTETTRAIYVGTAGNIAVVFASGATATLVSAIAGSLLPVRISAVKATGTTASNLVALV